MTDSDNNISPEEAKAALDAVKQTEQKSKQRSVPSKALGIQVALLMGGVVAAGAARKTELIAVFLAALAGAFVYERQKVGAGPTASPDGGKGMIAMMGLAIFAFILIAGSRMAMELYNLAWAPVGSGMIMAMVIYWLAASERAAAGKEETTDE